MPALNTTLSSENVTHPLDLLEHVMDIYEWEFERFSHSEMTVQAPGQWCDYLLYFSWSEELSVLHLNCLVDFKVPQTKTGLMQELIALANNRLWIGHFVIDNETRSPSYRHTLLVRGIRELPTENMEDLIDIALSECDRLYPAFQFTLRGAYTPQDALDAAMLDCAGDA